MVSAFARPSDVVSQRVVNGRALSNWLYGSNANNDGAVINHSIVHPDYMETISENNFAALVSSLAGKPTPEAAFFNSDVVYDALVDLNFVAGSSYPPGPPIAAPGGTIFIPGGANIYYPQGNKLGNGASDAFCLDRRPGERLWL
jgi:hypothetical protein